MVVFDAWRAYRRGFRRQRRFLEDHLQPRSVGATGATGQAVAGPSVSAMPPGLSPRTSALQDLRSLVGVASLVAVLFANGLPDEDGMLRLATSAAQAPLYKLLVTLPCFLLGVAVTVAYRSGQVRAREAWWHVQPVVLALAVTLGGPALVWATFAYGRARLVEGQVTSVSVGVLIALLLLLPYALSAYVRTQYLAIRYSFRAVHVHRYLPASVGLALAMWGLWEARDDFTTSPTRFERDLGAASALGFVVLALLCVAEVLIIRNEGRQHSRGSWRPRLQAPDRDGAAVLAVAGLGVLTLAAGEALAVAPVGAAVRRAAKDVGADLLAATGPREGTYPLNRRSRGRQERRSSLRPGWRTGPCASPWSTGTTTGSATSQ